MALWCELTRRTKPARAMGRNLLVRRGRTLVAFCIFLLPQKGARSVDGNFPICFIRPKAGEKGRSGPSTHSYLMTTSVSTLIPCHLSDLMTCCSRLVHVDTAYMHMCMYLINCESLNAHIEHGGIRCVGLSSPHPS